jgi:predicted DNA-binding transcriptional regulator AlpA
MQTELLDKGEVCRYFGGSRPLHPATLYRLIKAGRIPSPIHIGASSRWLRQECEKALAAMMEARS